MTPADRESLRRIAYGPDATAEERAEAASELRERDEQARLAREALHAESVASALESDEPPEVSDENSKPLTVDDDDDGYPDEPPLWQRRIRVAWLIPIAIGSLLLGVVGAMGVSRQLTSPDPLAAASEGPVVSEVALGSLTAAETWFKKPYAPTDFFPGFTLLDSYGIDASDVRFSGGNGAWFARTDSELCLLAINYDPGYGASCVSRSEFGRSGIALSVGSLNFYWLGEDVRVTGPRPLAENVIREAPDPGQGNVEAANSFFDALATEDDAFPIGRVLDSSDVDPSDVRFVGSDDHGHGLWAAKRRSGGFCLASYDIRLGNVSFGCATTQEFATSGVGLAAGGFAASWNGTEFLATGTLRLAGS